MAWIGPLLARTVQSTDPNRRRRHHRGIPTVAIRTKSETCVVAHDLSSHHDDGLSESYFVLRDECRSMSMIILIIIHIVVIVIVIIRSIDQKSVFLFCGTTGTAGYTQQQNFSAPPQFLTEEGKSAQAEVVHYSMATGDATTNCYCTYKPGHQCSYGCYQTKDYGSYYAYGYQAWYAVATVATKPTADRSYQPYSHRWVMVGCTSTSMITTW